MRQISRVSPLSLVFGALIASACGGDASRKPNADDAAPAAAPSARSAPAPTGKVITIEMTTDENGNYFTPKNVEAHRGDVLKFVLVAGVHNVHFLADSNPGVADLPAMSAFAQLPGQAIEIPVNFPSGKSYYFQCDPHALLGMVGRVKVED